MEPQVSKLGVNVIYINENALVVTEWMPDRGRALKSMRSLPAGTLLLEEKPLLQWKRGTYDPVVILENQVLGHSDIINILGQLSPRDTDVDATKMYQAKTAVSSVFSKKVVPTVSIEELARLFYVLETNSFPSGLFPLIARCNHSCVPNARVLDLDTHYKLELIRDVHEDEEICISYLENPEKMTTKQRQRHLEAQYFFECKCSACSNKLSEYYLCPSCKQGKIKEDCCDVCKIRLNEKQMDRLMTLDEELQVQFGIITDKIARSGEAHKRTIALNFLKKLLKTYHPEHLYVKALQAFAQ